MEESSQISEDETCGCNAGCCSHRRNICGSLQPFASLKCALSLLCLAQIVLQTVKAGLLSVCISTLEKRFELQSIESGLIVSSLDIAAVCALVIISFMREDVHKPRWVGWGLFMTGIGSLLFTLPHFIAPTYTYVETETFNYCGNVTASECTSESNMRDFKYVFIAAMAIFGVGINPIFTHAVTYIDENVKKEHSSFYTGIYYASGGVGPAIGYICGGATLQIFTNINTELDEGIDSSSYAWVGAWWLGFFVCGLFLILNAIPILLLPKYIPGTERHRINRNVEVQKSMIRTGNEAEQEKSGFSKRWSNVAMVLTNKPYVFISLGAAVNCAFIFGFNTFGAKYVESVFDLLPFHAALLYGIAAVIAAVGGYTLGGIVVAKFALSVQGILRLMIALGIFSALCAGGFFVHCPNTDFAGGTAPFLNETLSRSPTASCNMNCNCSTDRYEPVCGEDGVTYFSPCFAGCTTKLNETVYSNCSCVPAIGNSSEESIAILQSCEKDPCSAVIPFTFMIFLCFFSSILTAPMSVQVTLRCVPFDNRTTAISLQRIFTLVLGVIPGRILTGKVLDLACVMWSTECGEQGSCRAYKRWDLARNATFLLLAQTTACVFFYILVYLTYKPEVQEETEDDDKNHDENLSQIEAISDGENQEDSALIGANAKNKNIIVDEGASVA